MCGCERGGGNVQGSRQGGGHPSLNAGGGGGGGGGLPSSHIARQWCDPLVGGGLPTCFHWCMGDHTPR